MTKGICLAIFVCSRLRSNTNGNLLGVYNDRVPRWKQSKYPVYIIDSCNETLGAPFTVAGMQTFSFSGETSFWCSWQCPTQRETVALIFMQEHLHDSCSFVFKITGKYYTPDLIPQLRNMPENTTIAIQTGLKSSEIFGMRRDILATYLQTYNKSRHTQEGRLQIFAARERARNTLFELKKMKLYNFTRRSDGWILRYL